MDDRTDDNFLFLAYAQRFFHVELSIQSFAHATLHRFRDYALRLDADDFINLGCDGDDGQKSPFYRHAEILAKNRGVVCLKIPMERNCVFERVACDSVAFPWGSFARAAHRGDGVCVDCVAFLFQRSLYGRRNGGDR